MSWRITLIFLPLLTHAARVNGKRFNTGYFELNTSSTQGSCKPSTVKERPVYLLVTNHGFTCGDIINKFKVSNPWGSYKVQDTLLTSAGVLKSHQLANDVEKWLEQQGPNFKIDAVLSSNLERTMETAAVQYPGQNTFSIKQELPENTVTVFPFIKGRSRWYSQWFTTKKENRAKPLEQQVTDVRDAVTIDAALQGSVKLSVDNSYLNNLREFGGKSHKEWDKFKNYLARTLLRDLDDKLKKPPDHPFVIAVVTQPDVMNDVKGEISEQCHDVFFKQPRSGKYKANRNQVVSIPYVFQTKVPGEDCAVRTKEYSLEIQSGTGSKCANVTNGHWLYDKGADTPRPMCRKDIGKSCDNIQEDKTMGFILENQILKEHKVLESQRKAIKVFEKKLKALQGEVKSGIEGRKFESRDKTKLLNLLKNEEYYDQMLHKLKQGEIDFNALKQTQCWTGNTPVWDGQPSPMDDPVESQYGELKRQWNEKAPIQVTDEKKPAPTLPTAPTLKKTSPPLPKVPPARVRERKPPPLPDKPPPLPDKPPPLPDGPPPVTPSNSGESNPYIQPLTPPKPKPRPTGQNAPKPKARQNLMAALNDPNALKKLKKGKPRANTAPGELQKKKKIGLLDELRNRQNKNKLKKVKPTEKPARKLSDIEQQLQARYSATHGEEEDDDEDEDDDWYNKDGWDD